MATKNAAGTPAEVDEYFRDRIANYQGDSYLVDELIETGYTAEGAQREIADLKTIKALLEFDSLPDILADRTACKALKDALLARRPDIVKAVVTAAKKWLKRGPTGKMVDGEHLYERVWRLREEEHLTWQQLTRKVYGDPSRIALAKAHYRQAKARRAAIGADVEAELRKERRE